MDLTGKQRDEQERAIDRTTIASPTRYLRADHALGAVQNLGKQIAAITSRALEVKLVVGKQRISPKGVVHLQHSG